MGTGGYITWCAAPGGTLAYYQFGYTHHYVLQSMLHYTSYITPNILHISLLALHTSITRHRDDKVTGEEIM